MADREYTQAWLIRLRQTEADTMRNAALVSIGIAAIGAALPLSPWIITRPHIGSLLFIGIGLLILNSLIVIDYLFQTDADELKKIIRYLEDKHDDKNHIFIKDRVYRFFCRSAMWIGSACIYISFTLPAILHH